MRLLSAPIIIRCTRTTGPQVASCRRAISVTHHQVPVQNKRVMLVNNDLQNLSLKLIHNRLSNPVSHQSSRNSSNESGDKPKLTPRERIKNMINSSNKRVFVFMKGVPEAPQCGYSNAVVQILDAYAVEYDSCDVLADDEIRQEIKAYSSWPTIPQVYVDKSFVGGCDILIQMHQNNELEDLFKADKPK